METRAVVMDFASMYIGLYTCYYSAFLLFLAGLNRLIAFGKQSPALAYLRKWMCLVLALVGILSSLLAHFYLYLTGMTRSYDPGMGMMVTTVTNLNLAKAISYIVYLIPLSSTIFYYLVYQRLRAQRGDAISDRTKQLLTCAELSTFKIGCALLSTYVVSLSAHIAMDFENQEESVTLARVDEIVSTFPQIGLPLSLLLCNKTPTAITVDGRAQTTVMSTPPESSGATTSARPAPEGPETSGVFERVSVIVTPVKKNYDDQKRRQKNTEAARRCREKIKQKADRLQNELRQLRESNNRKNEVREDLIQKIRDSIDQIQVRALTAPEEEKTQILTEANQIIVNYLETVKIQRAQARQRMPTPRSSPD
ncbi:unnamed protein product [Caenorhabditis auriculariae]|uniref:BZIP domain-containing protein n=1 Tax=Caenorhabditis auriculariae TaxID=2777116 RepID=A0A8S1GU48_9PELO|nr:unnamed protein product [Caenorhabditis auriculariae]